MTTNDWMQRRLESQLPRDLTQLAPTYRKMAEADHRPASPSSEGVDVPLSDAEIEEYARRFLREESDGTYRIGTANFQTLGVLPFLIEAARLLCLGSIGNEMALQMARLAVAELEAIAARHGDPTAN